MKKILLLTFMLFITGVLCSQNLDNKEKIKQANKKLNNVEKFIKQKYYHKAYNEIEEVEMIIPESKKLKKVYLKLKKEAPTKPVEDCDKLQEKVNRGEVVSDPHWFFYSCPQYKTKNK